MTHKAEIQTISSTQTVESEALDPLLQSSVPPGSYVLLNRIISGIHEYGQMLDIQVEDLTIVLTVLAGNLQRWHRSTDISTETTAYDEIVDLVPMSQSAISRSTNIARETIRRRLHYLSNRGIVSIDHNGSAKIQTAVAKRMLNATHFTFLTNLIHSAEID